MVKMVLFDVDGVLLSEERYFDASALTVWEMLTSKNYLGLRPDKFEPTPEETSIQQIRDEVFCHDDVLSFMKSRGINANWDMVYLSFAHQMISQLAMLGPEKREEIAPLFQKSITRESLKKMAELLSSLSAPFDFASFVTDFEKSTAQKQELLLYLNTIAEQKLGVQTNLFSRNSALWELCQETFQEWYLGDQLISESIGHAAIQAGKKGFLSDEIPIVDPKRMAEVLSSLKEKGIILGIGTGRPTIETMIPLQEIGLLPYFDEERIVTASHVLEAEEKLPDLAPLGKPQPFCYIKGWLGLSTADEECLAVKLPIERADELLIIGDSVADYMAAKSIGCRFAATLTGLSGQAEREKFEELKADYILNDMTEILQIFNQKVK
jgi:phosphoglycolate phosphatase-like HAD superfamily hydrolase